MTKETLKEKIISEIAQLQKEYFRFENQWRNPKNTKEVDSAYMHLMDIVDNKMDVLYCDLDDLDIPVSFTDLRSIK